MAPRYLTAQLQQASNVGYRQHLRSLSLAKLDVPLIEHMTIGGRAFSSTGARVWNSLPMAVQSSESLDIFRRRLKTELIRAFLQLRPHLSNNFTAAWLTFTFLQLFAVAAALKSIDYNVAIAFILNNNNFKSNIILDAELDVVAVFKILAKYDNFGPSYKIFSGVYCYLDTM